MLFASSSQSNVPSSTVENNGSNPSSTTPKQIVVDPFCYRQFREFYKDDVAAASNNNDYTGTIFDITILEFERIVNERYTNDTTTLSLKDGYAPFCKHLFIQNDFTNAVVNVLPITNENEHLLRTKYVARNDKELPVLIRYFPKELLPNKESLPIAKYLDLILYSREQINLENQATEKDNKVNNDDDDNDPNDISTPDPSPIVVTAPWGIVSIKAQDMNMELPMTPITNMRNALGKEYGGSGIPIDYDKYMECIQYWKDHATIS